MVIGIDTSQANQTHRRGTEWYAYHIIQELKKIADPHDRFILYSEEPLRDGLEDLPSNFSSRVLRWPPRFLWNLLRFSVEMMVRPPDVLFSPAHTIPLWRPKRSVTTLHDVGFEIHPELYSKKRIGPGSALIQMLLGFAARIITLGRYSNTELDYHRWSARFAIKHATRILTVSAFSKNEIMRYLGKPRNDIRVIPNGIDPHAFLSFEAEREKGVLAKYSITAPYFFWIGRLELKKNVQALIHAFEQYSTLRDDDRTALVLAGVAGYGYARIRQTIESSRTSARIHEIGYVDQEDLPYLYHAAQAFILPSAYEGFGIPIIEAMASGTPVIISRAGSNTEIAKDAALTFDPNDPRECAEALSSLVLDPQSAKDRIERGRHYAAAYSWEHTAREIYHELKLPENG